MNSETPRIRFLRAQHAAALLMNEESHLVHIEPIPDEDPPSRYLVTFSCTGLVGTSAENVRQAAQFAVGIWFPEDYLRTAEPGRVLTWLAPVEIYHPNVAAPYICAGPIHPATRLVELVHRVHDIITYANYGTDERDCLNREACRYARANTHLFPLDTRPLKRPCADAPQGGEDMR